MGEITLLGLTRSDNVEYNLRYSFVLKENLVHDDPSVPEEAKIFFKINGANENGAPLRIDATLIVDIFDDAPAMKDIWYESPDLAISHSGHFVGLLGVEGGLGFDFGADGKSSGATPSFRIGYGPMDVESQSFESVAEETGYSESPGELGRVSGNTDTGPSC